MDLSPSLLRSALAVALAVLSPAIPAFARDPGDSVRAAVLLESYARQLAAEPESEDVERIRDELARQESLAGPSLRVGQKGTLSFDGRSALSVWTSAVLPVENPAAAADLRLVRQRLVLARQDEAKRKAAALIELHRSLLLLAHLGQVQEVLEGHLAVLGDTYPGAASVWTGEAPRGPEGAELEAGQGTPGRSSRRVPPGVLEYAEVAQALARTRGEREIVAASIALELGVEAHTLLASAVGRPPLPRAEEGARPPDCALGHELARAAAAFEEVRLGEVARRARTQLTARLELTGSLRYGSGRGGGGLDGEARVALRVSLPPVAGASTSAELRVGADGLEQELAATWPGPGRPSSAGSAVSPGRKGEELEAEARARLAALRRAQAYEAGQARLRARQLALDAARREALTPAGQRSPVALGAYAKARIGLLNAELEADMATLELVGDCLWEELSQPQASTVDTSRRSVSRRVTISSNSAWTSSIRPSSLRTKRV